jgi:subtilisin family serine protease
MPKINLTCVRSRLWRTALLSYALALPVLAQVPIETHNSRPVVAAQVLVRFRSATAAAIASARALADADQIIPLSASANIHLIHSRSKNVAGLLTALAAQSDVVYVEPDYILHAVATPNDPYFSALWGLKNTATPGADISATSAWDVSTGSAANVVGVIDTGIDYAHADLAANVWSASAAFSVSIGGSPITCPAGSHGFNAITNSCDPKDDHNHGTHVSGTIGAVGNNATGVAGVNWTTRVMGLKFLSSAGSGSTSDAIKAIEFAIQAKAVLGSAANVRVLSNSWGGDGFSSALLDEINKANTNDMLFVVAAGNNGTNNDVTPFYPASYNAPNIFAVAATDSTDALASFSNYGAATVHLGAPGVNIYSTVIGGYNYFSGTSMATPHVSGAAMLLLSACSLNTAALRNLILSNVDPIPALSGKTVTGGRLNVNRAIRACASAPTYTLSASPASVSPGATIYVAWTAPPGHSAYDWIALYPTGSSNSAYGWWQYTGAATSGNFAVPAPANTGSYEFRYLLNNGYTDAARSGTVSVTGPVGPAISGVAATVITASSATISWNTDVVSDSQVDYGTVLPYALSSPLSSTLVIAHSVALSGLSPSTTYHYRVKSRNSAGVLTTSGDFTFTTAAAAATYSLSASPAGVSAGATVTVSWTAPAGSSLYDWVALYPTGSPNNAFLAWQYTGGATSGSFAVSAPANPGTYEFRYLLNNGYTDVVRSNIVTVGSASYTVTAAPGSLPHGSTITVNWTAPSGHSAYDWIGLYLTGTANTQYVWWTYTGGALSGTLLVTAPATAGSYEFRYLLNNGFTDAAKSNPVTVQ